MFHKIRDFIRRHFIGYRPTDMPCLDYLEYLESKGEGTMKVIDLLNKIANGEEVPKKIKYKDDIYIHVDNHCYVCEETYEILSNNIYAEHNSLNDEIEIIEEDKKIEKLPMIDGTANILLATNQTRRKINEIIDYINKGE